MRRSERLKIYKDRIREISSDWWLFFLNKDKPYIEYYKAIMKRNTAIDPMSAVGFTDIGKRQIRRLKIHGLKPHHTVLDLGCGCLRGGRYIIEYLESGNYTGNDISPEILKEAEEVIVRCNLSDKKPKLYQIFDNEFDNDDNKYDYIHAQSVLSHVPPEDMEVILKNIKKVMKKDTKFLTSFFLSTNGKVYSSNQKRNFNYPLDWMQDLCKRNGLKARRVEDDSEDTGKQKLLEITFI